MKTLRIGIVITILFSTQLYSQDEICDYQEGQIRVTAQQISKDPDSYVFLVTNLTDAPLWSFSIGSSKETMLKPTFDNKPQNITGPEGWKAFDRIGGDGTLGYVWANDTQDKALDIPSQSSNSEFRIYLKEIGPYRYKIYDDNGKLDMQTKIKGLKYMAKTRGRGKYKCGTIDVVDYIQSEI